MNKTKWPYPEGSIVFQTVTGIDAEFAGYCCCKSPHCHGIIVQETTKTRGIWIWESLLPKSRIAFEIVNELRKINY